MDSLVCSAAALLSASLPTSLEDSFVVYFQRKTFLDSWSVCKKRWQPGHHQMEGGCSRYRHLFSTEELHHSHVKVQVWIGLQHQSLQGAITLFYPLWSFSETTGEQGIEYTSWQKTDPRTLGQMPDWTCAGSNQEPIQESQSLECLTDPPRVLIWVISNTGGPVLWFSAGLVTEGTDEDDSADWSEGPQMSDWAESFVPTALFAPSALVLPHTSAGRMRMRLPQLFPCTPPQQSPSESESRKFTEFSYQTEPVGERQRNLLFQLKEEELRKVEKDFVEITHSQNLAVLTKPTFSPAKQVREEW